MTHRWRMPAEWEPHQATLLTWPHDADIWGELHEDIEGTFAVLTALLARAEEVHIAAPPSRLAAVRARVEQAGADMAQVHLHPIDSDDCWTRDHGPIAVVPAGTPAPDQPPRLLLDWRFNAWGGKFPHQRDAAVARAFAQALGLPVRSVDRILEGGAIDVNGAGDLLTTRAVLLNCNRAQAGEGVRDAAEHSADRAAEDTSAPATDPAADWRDILGETLGVERIHWLEEGLEGDDTDGHVDDIARFLDPWTVAIVTPANVHHPDHGAMERNRRILAEARGPGGRPFTLVALPAPEPVRVAGEMVPASYANFLIANGQVIVPTFAQPADDVALGTLCEHFPGREVVGLDARALITQSGAVHCVTQQLPAAGGVP